MQTNVYTLPELNFVGGETQEIHFYLKKPDGTAFNADGATADFAICNYSNKTGEPIKSYTPTFVTDGSGVLSILIVEIPAADTVELAGKFIYQITVIDINGDSEIPNQGIMNISRNIHQDYILNPPESPTPSE